MPKKKEDEKMANENIGWLLGRLFGYANELQRLYIFCKNPANLVRQGGVGSNAFELARTKK